MISSARISLLAKFSCASSRHRFIPYLALSLTFFVPISARAQQSRLDLSLDYSYLRANPDGNGYSFNSNGGVASASWRLKPWLRLAADFSGYDFGGQPATVSGKLFTYAAGPRFSRRIKSTRWTPFAQTLAGGARVSGNLNGLSAAENGFSLLAGGGLDLSFRPRIAFRVAEFDYVLTRFNRVLNANGPQNDFRFSAGVVFHLPRL